MSKKALVVLGIVILAIGAFFVFDLSRFLTLDYLQTTRAEALRWVDERPVTSLLVFFSSYVAVTALSLPGAAVMTLAGGALFGLGWGMVLVSFASSIGATLAFLVSRSVLGEWVQSRFSDELEGINAGLEKDGNFFLFTLRMVPLFPFFVVNLVMGLTPMRVLPFYLVSQVGMLPGTFVFVFAGTQLVEIQAIGDVLSPGLIVALSLLGVFPLVAKKIMAFVNKRRGVDPEAVVAEAQDGD